MKIVRNTAPVSHVAFIGLEKLHLIWPNYNYEKKNVVNRYPLFKNIISLCSLGTVTSWSHHVRTAEASRLTRWRIVRGICAGSTAGCSMCWWLLVRLKIRSFNVSHVVGVHPFPHVGTLCFIIFLGEHTIAREHMKHSVMGVREYNPHSQDMSNIESCVLNVSPMSLGRGGKGKRKDLDLWCSVCEQGECLLDHHLHLWFSFSPFKIISTLTFAAVAKGYKIRVYLVYFKFFS